MFNQSKIVSWVSSISWLTLTAYIGLLCLSVLHFHPASYHADEHDCHDEISFSAPFHICDGETNASCSLCQILNSAAYYELISLPELFQQQDIVTIAYFKPIAFLQTITTKSVRAPPVFVS